jgi:cytochrome c2
MTVPVVATIIVSGVGFASVGSYTGQVEAKETPSTQVELGQNLFIAKGCIVCHHYKGMEEVRRNFSEFRVGPDLPSLMTMSAEPATIHTWLKDPTAIKPDTKMPNLELKKTEIEALTAFLLNSKPADGSAETTSVDRENLRPSSQ